MKIYFSHTGNELLKNKYEFDLNVASLKNAIEELNKEVRGIKSCIVDDEGQLLSSVRIFNNIECVENYGCKTFLETDNTNEIKDINVTIDENWNNILISLFELNGFKDLISKALSDDTSYEFKFRKNNELKNTNYKAMLASPEDYDIKQEVEHIKKFRDGEMILNNLSILDGEEINIVTNSFGFVKKKSKVIPKILVESLVNDWGVKIDELKLRLFQEDSMFYIMAMLQKKIIKEQVFLLSMPTGGGKTEAFMLPIISNILLNKKVKKNNTGIKSMIIYPTKALANDQAMRFVNLVYKINSDLKSKYRFNEIISIGVLSGDTPRQLNSSTRNKTEINICPECGNSNFDYDQGTLVCQAIKDGKVCGTRLEFCRLSKEDILDNPPDILITNPDMINYTLHSPRYSKLFNNLIESVVFDEVHFYQGIFGCHLAHLLRRLEERINYKPTYIGLSATIGNAEELAALLFNEKLENVKYIHNKNSDYTTNEVEKERYHLLLKPAKIDEDKDKNEKRYIRTISVANIVGMFIAHLVTDCHFRKTIIFANYKNDADEMAKLFQERQEFDVKNYFKTILDKLISGKELNDEEIEIAKYIDRWLSILNKYSNYNKNRIIVGWNRGGLERDHRIKSIQRFILNKNIEERKKDKKVTVYPNDVMIATKTLEVGIDIGDVTTVINSSAPFTTNEYTQRVGRAGRKKDSLAITIINPESGIDTFFEKYFNNYVNGTDYEDAPIITSNSLIFERHIYARVLDYIAGVMSRNSKYHNKNEVLIKDFISNLQLNIEGRTISINEQSGPKDINDFTDYVFAEIFESYINGYKKIDILLESFENEREIIGFTNTDINYDFVKDHFTKMFKYLIDKVFDKQSGWEIDDSLSGFRSVEKKLTPSLRGSGATVDLKLASFGDSKVMETVPRYRAFVSIPPATDKVATLSSGVETFNVKNANIEQDFDAKKIIRRAVAQDEKAISYFRKKLDNFPRSKDPEDIKYDFDAVVPKEIEVKHFPNRFYCPSCQKGLIPPYDIAEGDAYMCKCGAKAIQLHSINICLNEECGHLMEPPVPKVCINDNCDDFKKFYSKFKANGYVYKPEFSEHFRFRLTRNLEWVCSKCNTKMNFHQYYKNNRNNKVRGTNWESPVEYTNYILNNPEVYKKNHNNTSNFTCDVNRGEHKKVGITTVPRVRTIFSTYYSEPKQQICDEISVEDLCSVSFVKGNIVQLAEKFSRRFTSGLKEKNSELKIADIFKEKTLLGNYLETHILYISFDSVLDNFINNYSGKCNLDCSNCEVLNELDLGSVMKPRTSLKSYQVSSDGPNKPDPRGVFCERALNNTCKTISCINSGEFCKDFDSKKFMKYIVLHTIKHGLLWAMPKYAGVNVSEIRGDVFPNDGTGAGDIVLYDSNEGGSGAVLLIQKNWDNIWKFAEELIDNVVNNDANLILPHTCNRFNQDLCPVITKEFLDFFNER